jgi:regulator-associated protein of mTOR
MEDGIEEWSMRHGFTGQHNAEQLQQLAGSFYMYYLEKRHELGGISHDKGFDSAPEWRMRDRLKTVSAIMALCLNIGVEPPGGMKVSPAPKLQCWIDPLGPIPGNNAMGAIAKALQGQYEQLSMRTRYKVLSDPTSDEIKKYATTVRRNARDERILFHYNGHGVPEPTVSGELWFFNKNYTQYIPVSLWEMQDYLGAPTILVLDCSNAARIIQNWHGNSHKHAEKLAERQRVEPSTRPWHFEECIILAATGAEEKLPSNPLLPADLFTSCTTTPIEMAVRFFLMQSPLHKHVDLDKAKIPGRQQERRTPLGELTWIFTAITDTIAWNLLPRKLFKRLFRQDLMVAAKFRNFLLAQRIMRAFGCHPESYPAIPSTHEHPLWRSWDLAIELVLAQLQTEEMKVAIQQKDEKLIEEIYVSSDFFRDQLTAFEVYLDHGARDEQEPPQLPIVLQVLLSQAHRLRALVLLSRFLDLGPWAVRLALSIGIFPYVLKLLQSQAADLKAPLIYIWARMLAVDSTCQTDLLKDNGYTYFASMMSPEHGLPIGKISEHRAMSAFIIAMFCRDHQQGQLASQSADMVAGCLKFISFRENDNPVLRQWACLCLGTLWSRYSEPKWSAIQQNGHMALCELVSDPVPEVRASMLYAMSTFIGIEDTNNHVLAIEEEIAMRLLAASKDSCVIVRKELVVFLSSFIDRYMKRIIVAATVNLHDEMHVTLERLQEEANESQEDEHLAAMKSNSLDSNGSDVNSEKSPVSDESPNSKGSASGDNQSDNTSTSRQRRMSGTTIAERVSLDSRPNGSSRPTTKKQLRSRDSPCMAVWLNILILALDPDIQVNRLASHTVRAVIHAAMKERGIKEFAGDLLAVYSQYMSATTPSHTKPSATVAAAQTAAAIPTQTLATPSELPRADGYLSIGIRRTASVAASIASLAFGGGTPGSSAAHTTSPPRTAHRPDGVARQATMNGKSFGDLTKVDEDGEQSSRYRRAQYPIPLWYTDDIRIASWGGQLPVASDIFDYCLETFKEPQMASLEEDEPGSDIYNQRMFRRNRNEEILEQTQKMKEPASKSRWEKQVGYFNNGFQPSVMCFHQFETQMVIADDCDTIRYVTVLECTGP